MSVGTTSASAFTAISQIEAGVLDVGYVDSGEADGPAVLLLHGWPYDIFSYEEVTPRLVAAGCRVVVPYLRGYGTTRFLSNDTSRNGEQAALALDAIALMDALGIEKAIVAGFDWGARTADIVAALWPERCSGLVSVSGYLIGSQAAGQVPLPPEAELQWWYQYYFATDRGRAGYETYRREFAKLIWRLASPKWKFDDATFDRSAASFDNPDHVAIVIHNYRWRLGLADGEPDTRNPSNGSPTAPSSPYPPSGSKVTPTAPRMRALTRTQRSSRGPIRTGRSRAASDTTFRRKRPRLSRKRYSNLRAGSLDE
jgi:pimeloyl-ACP methyl ester carboxylesterase